MRQTFDKTEKEAISESGDRAYSKLAEVNYRTMVPRNMVRGSEIRFNEKLATRR